MSDTLQNTIDGQKIVTVLAPSDCCPPTLCNLDLNTFICSFFAYLPKGPLWDYWKRIKAEQLLNGTSGCEPYQDTENSCCLTLIDHAAYTATKLYNILRGPLQSSIWESNPLTAFVTRQNWLNSYGWIDCFSGPSSNAALGFPTPYQAVCNALLPSSLCSPGEGLNQMTGNNTASLPNPVINIETLVKEACPVDLTNAVEYGILCAIQRLQLGVIKNIDGINFILAPLGASISVVNTGVETVCQNVMVYDCNQIPGTTPCYPKRPKMTIALSQNSITLPAGPGITEPLSCDNIQTLKTTVYASYYFEGVAMPTTADCPEGTIAGAGTIWPGLMAAECILFSILPYYLNYSVNRI